MASAKDFVIKSGKLTKYTGTDTDVIIPKSVKKIVSGAFGYYTKMKSITIPDSVQEIEFNAFEGCNKLQAAGIPHGITAIQGSTFSGCSKLETVILPETVTEIGSEAFSRCGSLKSISIPDSLEKVIMNPFPGCKSLEFNEYGNACYLGNEKNPFVLLVKASSTDITAVDIHPDTKLICGDAFKGCHNLESVVLPEQVRFIGDAAFKDCYSLKYMTFPKSLCQIRPSSGLEKCNKLTCIIAPRTAPELIQEHDLLLPATIGYLLHSQEYEDADYYLQYAVSQKKRILPILFEGDLVQGIAVYAENGKINVQNVDKEFLEPATQANATQCVAYLMDWQNKNISSARKEKQLSKEVNADPYSAATLKEEWTWEKLPDGTYTITNYKGNATEVLIPERIGKVPVTQIKGTAFEVRKKERPQNRRDALRAISKIVIPEGVTILPFYAFNGCTGLTTVLIPDCVKVIELGAFCDCESLVDIVFPAKLTKIGVCAFSNCRGLVTVVLPNSVGNIGGSAFAHCENLTNIYIPRKVKKLDPSTFSGCPKLTIHAPAGSYAETYAKENNIPFIAE